MRKIIILLAIAFGLSALNLTAQTNDDKGDKRSRKEQREKKRMEKRDRADRQKQPMPQMQQAPDQPVNPMYGRPMGPGQGRRQGAFAPNMQGPRGRGQQGWGPGAIGPRGNAWQPPCCPNCGRPLGRGNGQQAWMGRGQGFGRGGFQGFAPQFDNSQNMRPMRRSPGFAPQPNNPQPQAPAQNFERPMRRGPGGPGAPFNRPGPRFQSQAPTPQPENK